METKRIRSKFYETLTREKALQLAGGLLDEDTTKEQYKDAWQWIHDGVFYRNEEFPEWYKKQSYFKSEAGEIKMYN